VQKKTLHASIGLDFMQLFTENKINIILTFFVRKLISVQYESGDGLADNKNYY
jgi:hypothetical protein